MSENTCNCHSYNGDFGEAPEVILHPPKDLGIVDAEGKLKDSVCVDACIAGVINYLWSHGILTLNSCCGHGRDRPSIILKDRITEEEAFIVRRRIAEVDTRFFDLLSWKLTSV